MTNAQIAPGTRDDLSGGTIRRKSSMMSKGAAAGLAIVLLIVGLAGGVVVGKYVLSSSSSGGGSAAVTSITETGSSLIFPAMSLWGPGFSKLYPNVNVTPQSTGSGTGQSSAEAGTVDIGGTDVWLNTTTASQDTLLNFPSAISAQLIFYNLPGISSSTHLNLNGTIIAMIYSGAITNWNNPLIQAANPGVSLPSNAIVPIHRSDGSGDTGMFSSMCELSWTGWTFGHGTTIKWIASSPSYNGNGGMVTGLSNTQYGIAYIGISYLSQASAAGLGYAALGDNLANSATGGTDAANYVLPTSQNIAYDANLGLQYLAPPSLAVSLILGGDVVGTTNGPTIYPGEGGTNPTAAYPTPYPDVNLEYLLIQEHPKDLSHQKYVVQFLEWILSYGQTSQYLSAVNFLPLTPAIIGYDMSSLQLVSVSN